MRRTALLAAALFGLVALLYGRALGFEFVFDDRVLLEGNAALGDLGTLPEALTSELFHFSSTRASPYWRPTITATYYLERALFGAGPVGFHLGSLLWAGLASFALFLVVRDHHGERAGLVAAVLLTAHPLVVEPVVNIASRTDVVCAALALLALRSRPGLAAVLAFLACGAKEPAVLLPLAALALDRRERRWIGMAVGVGLYVVLRFVVLLDVDVEASGPTSASAFGAGERMLHLLARVVFPWGGSPAAEVPPAGGALAAVAWLGVLTLCAGLARTRGLGRVGALFVLVPLLLVSGLLQGEPRFGDGLVYLPLVGVLLIASSRLAELPTWAVGGLVLLCAGLGQGRVSEWKDERTLWEATHERIPNDGAVRLNLARTLVDDDPERALELLAEPLPFTDTRRQGEVAEVRAYASVATGRDPRADLVVALRGDASPWTLAMSCVHALPETCARAVQVSPDDPALWDAWGIEAGPGAERVERFERACALSPDEGPYCDHHTRSVLELAPGGQDGVP